MAQPLWSCFMVLHIGVFIILKFTPSFFRYLSSVLFLLPQGPLLKVKKHRREHQETLKVRTFIWRVAYTHTFSAPMMYQTLSKFVIYITS